VAEAAIEALHGAFPSRDTRHKPNANEKREFELHVLPSDVKVIDIDDVMERTVLFALDTLL
jgi:hypothetical protein